MILRRSPTRRRSTGTWAMTVAVAVILTTAPAAGAISASDQYIPSVEPAQRGGGGEASAPGTTPTDTGSKADPGRADGGSGAEAPGGAPTPGSGAGASDEPESSGIPPTPFLIVVAGLFGLGLAYRYLLPLVRSRPTGNS